MIVAHLLLTGGAGYIGSHCLHTLQEANHRVVVIDDLRSGQANFVRNAPLLRCSLEDQAAVEKVFADYGPFDGVLHFAASISVQESGERPLDYYANNVVGSFNLIRAALLAGVNSFVLSSTAAVYGNPTETPIRETSPAAPINPYGATKMMIERMLSDVETAHGMRWVALRYFNACGAAPEAGLGECHDPETHLIPVALETAAGLRDEFKLFGDDYETPDGTCVRDYIHVRDLASAHLLAIEALLEGCAGGAFNLGTGKGHSIRSVLATIESVVGKSVPTSIKSRRIGDPASLVADPSRFREQFGWVPQHSSLETIVSSAWDWAQQSLRS